LVNDPIEGNSVQVSTDLFKPVSAFQVFGILSLYVLLILTTLGSLIAVMIWGGKRMVNKLPFDSSAWMRLWPLISGWVFIGFLISMSLGGLFLQAYGSISILSLMVFLFSVAYPVITVFSVFKFFTYQYNSVSKWIVIYSVFYAGLNLLMAIHLAYYGLFALKTWA
jgi:hypothetical protein